MKYILVIGDGMADNPVESLGGRTPLEAAEKPALDALAAKGTVGSVVNCPEGLPPGSDTAILSIFGNDPRVCYTGRSPLEAAATGIALEPGDISYRCNMVALEEGDMPFSARKILSHSGGSIDGEESIALVEYLFAHPDFRAQAEAAGMKIYPAASFRHIAVQHAGDISGITLTPPHDHLGEAIGPLLPKGNDNAAVLSGLMALSFSILDGHPINAGRRSAGKLPANCVWFWAEGSAVALEPFADKYHKSGAVISAVPLCHGIARLSGLEVIEVEGATGELDTNYEGKVAAALEALERLDFAAIHVEAPDECTHNGDLPGKLQAISWLSSRVLAPLTAAMDSRNEPYRLLVLSDHKTLTATRGHDGDPVPYLLYDSRLDSGRGLSYTEANGLKGPFMDDGVHLMDLLFAQ